MKDSGKRYVPGYKLRRTSQFLKMKSSPTVKKRYESGGVCVGGGRGGISLLIIKYCTDKSCHCCAASSMGSDFYENVFSK